MPRFRPLRVSLFPILASCSVAFLSGNARDAAADIDDFEWQPATTLDLQVDRLGDASGRIAEFDFLGSEVWTVVYTKNDEIYLVEGDGNGWSSPTRITNDPAPSRKPGVSSTGTFLHVVWEDERSGRPEIWTRRFDGTAWTDAECLSCDATPSRAPAIEGSRGVYDEYGVVVWEDVTSDGSSSVVTRKFVEEAGVWGPAETISNPAGNATEPTVLVSLEGDNLVLWVDDRHGETEIYSRKYRDWPGVWEDEKRATDLPGNNRQPRVAGHHCCYDVIDLVPFVVFENGGSVAIESWGAVTDSWGGWEAPFLLSEDDGVPSVAPDVGGVKYYTNSCYDFDRNFSFVSWTDQTTEGDEQHFAQYQYDSKRYEESSPQPEVTATALAARTRSPNAPVLQLWLTAGGELAGREGHLFNCRQDATEFEPYFWISPEGGTNEIYLFDECTEEPLVNDGLRLRFYSGIDSRIAIDPFQDLEPQERSDENGIVSFTFRGGGCVTNEDGEDGVLIAGCDWSPFPTHGAYAYYFQFKSPDIDGTCTVDPWDVQYVIDRIGSDDFCADLDGSGLVDAADVQIVETALGEACEQTTNVPDHPGAESVPESLDRVLTVTPNPSAGDVRIEAQLSAGSESRLLVYDASGRLVRDLGSYEPTGDRTVALSWDRRTDSGRTVASGIYFLQLRDERSGRLDRATIVIR